MTQAAGTRGDLTGERFGRLTVNALIETRNGNRWWLCTCDCGKTRRACTAKLRFGWVRSCGCLKGQWNRKAA